MATCAQLRKRSGMHKLVRVPFALYGSSIPSLIGVGTTAGREVSDRILKSLPETPLQDRRLGTQTQERATSQTEAPGAKASPTIDRFCPRLHRRRRSGPDSTQLGSSHRLLHQCKRQCLAPCQLRPDKPRSARRPCRTVTFLRPDPYEVSPAAAKGDTDRRPLQVSRGKALPRGQGPRTTQRPRGEFAWHWRRKRALAAGLRGVLPAVHLALEFNQWSVPFRLCKPLGTISPTSLYTHPPIIADEPDKPTLEQAP